MTAQEVQSELKKLSAIGLIFEISSIIIKT